MVAQDSRTTILEGVFSAVRAGDVERAKRAAVDGLSRGVEHPVLLNLRALDFEAVGRLDDALSDLRRAHVLAPKDFTILNACGLCLARMNRLEEAERCYDQALAINPQFGQAWFNRAWVLERLGETVKAHDAYLQAVEIHPDNVEAWARLAWLAARRGNIEETRRLADAAFALQASHPTAMLALTNPAVSDPKEAESRLREMLAGPLTTHDRGLALGHLADALDAQDKPAQAFAAYEASNKLLRQDGEAQFVDASSESLLEALAWVNHWAESLDAGSWPVAVHNRGASVGVRSHVFLIGFARSGTTLIESILAANPDVVSLEERNTLDAASRRFLVGPAQLARLTAADEREIEDLRADYWDAVRRFGIDPNGKIFVDKNPMNTFKLPLIHRLFPEARILFAIRDPRDVVLSCFRRRFTLNPTTFEFLDLRRTASVYDLTMRLAETLRRRLNFAEHQLSYEQLVADPPSMARTACGFIGAEWRDEMLQIAERGRSGAVASASAAQITRGLYADGVGQWRRFKVQLGPVLPILAPWVEAFGYSTE